MFPSLLSAVELPQALEAFIALAVAGAVTFLVMEGFKALGSAFGSKDFSTIAKAVAAVASGAAVTLVLGLARVFLGLIPVEWEPIANIVLSALVALLSMGLHRIAKQRGLVPVSPKAKC
jgi:hypothetical protein